MKTAMTTRLSSYRCDMMRKAGAIQMPSVQEQIAKITGEGYFTYRLVRGERIARSVRQLTVLNLGRHFPILQDHWPLLCSRIEQLLAPQSLLCALECPEYLERAAQRFVA